jgi:hypothetical protein
MYDQVSVIQYQGQVSVILNCSNRHRRGRRWPGGRDRERRELRQAQAAGREAILPAGRPGYARRIPAEKGVAGKQMHDRAARGAGKTSNTRLAWKCVSEDPGDGWADKAVRARPRGRGHAPFAFPIQSIGLARRFRMGAQGA